MLFHVFNYRMSIQIFLLFKFLCTNLAWIKILRNSSTIFRSSHQRCSIKKLFLKILCYAQESTCAVFSFLLKLQDFRPLTALKRDFKTDIFLWISDFFCNCYLAAPQPTLGHSQGNSLTNPMLITAFYFN